MEDILLEGALPQEKTPTELTEEQQLKLLKFWNDYEKGGAPKLSECVNLIFPGADSRDKRGVLVRKFLASRQLKFTPILPTPKPDIVLTEEQQEYVINNCNNMRAGEMAVVLFPNVKITGFSKEVAAIKKFLNTLSNSIKNNPDGTAPAIFDNQDLATESYTPPKTASQVIRKINRYTNFGIDSDKLNQRQKKEIGSLINYLHCYRFTSQMSTYSTIDDRELFESSFIRGTYDKADLSSEEIDSYVLYSTEVVIGKNISQRLEEFQNRLDQNLEGDEKLSMAVVEAMKTLRDDHHKCVGRQQKILSDLTGTRKERIEGQIKEKASLVQLIEFFKNYENRQNMIKLADLRKQALKNEIGRLEDMDSLKFQLWGVDPNELLEN